MEYLDFKSIIKKYVKSTLLSLDLILGFAAVIFSYQWYVSRSGDNISSLVMILISLGYFIFYPYYLIKLLNKDKMRAMASIYASMLMSKIDKDNDHKEEDDAETKKDDNSR